MSTGIKLEGAKLDQVGLQAAADAVATVLESAYAAHADQDTVRAALDTLRQFGSVSNTAISNCQISL